jgi:hypothetical protein
LDIFEVIMTLRGIMLNRILCFRYLLIATVLVIAGCNKATTTNDSASAEDVNGISNVVNGVVDDATNSVGSMHALAGKTAGGMGSLCGTELSADSTNGLVVINYTGFNCSNKIFRTGTLTVTLQNYANGTRWKDAGAVLQLNFQNVKCNINATNASYTFNGICYIKNLTGGLAWQIINNITTGTVTHEIIADNLSITYSDGSARTWSLRRQRSFQDSASMVSITITGDTAVNGFANVDAWGTDRGGEPFTGSLISPIVSNNTCGFFSPVSGEYICQFARRKIDILYGVDENGFPVTAGNCAYGFQITYTAKNKTLVKIDSYY